MKKLWSCELQMHVCMLLLWHTYRWHCHSYSPHSSVNDPPTGVNVTVLTLSLSSPSGQWPTLWPMWLSAANGPPVGVVGTCQLPTSRRGGTCQWPSSRCGWHHSHKSHSCQSPSSRRRCHCPMFLPMTHSRCGCDCPHITVNDPQ